MKQIIALIIISFSVPWYCPAKDPQSCPIYIININAGIDSEHETVNESTLDAKQEPHQQTITIPLQQENQPPTDKLKVFVCLAIGFILSAINSKCQ